MATNTLIGWIIGAIVVLGGGYIIWDSMQSPAMMQQDSMATSSGAMMATSSDEMAASSSDQMMASSSDNMASSSGTMIDASTSVDAGMMAH